MFIDIHSHILPMLDDGAGSLLEACEIARRAYESGTDAMVATPHYLNPSKCMRQNDAQSIKRAFRELKEELAFRNIPLKMFLGAELLGSEFDITEKRELITINCSRYILVEFYFDDSIENALRCVNELLSLGLIPVIAHPERYGFFAESPVDVYRFLSKGCLFQINKDSPLGLYGQHAAELSVWLLNNDVVHVIAGDCHNDSFRNADMSGIYHFLLNRRSKEKIDMWLHDNPKRILLDKDIS